MKLYLIERPDGASYDEFDAFVIAAMDETDAKSVIAKSETWPDDPATLTVTYVGTAKRDTKRGVILGSFHAG